MNDGPLKVAVVPAWYPRTERPMHGIFVRDQVHAIARTNDVVVIADDGPRRAEGVAGLRDSVEQGIRTIRVSYRADATRSATFGYIRGVLAALARLRREGWRPDIVHAHIYYIGLVAELAKLRYRAPVAVSEHSSHFLLGTLNGADWIRAWLAFGLADVVCPVSRVLQRAIQGLNGRARFEVVPNPVDLSAFQPTPLPTSEPPQALVVAGLEPVKGIPNLLAAAASVTSAGREFRVNIVGDGPERVAYERLAREYGLAERVVFHGYQPRDTIAGFLRDAHFLVLPSRVETFGVVMLEALAAGRPVVATDVGVAPEVLTEGSGMVVPPEDSQALARAIDHMLDGYGRYSPTSLAAPIASRFSYDAVAQRWDEVYRGLTSRADRGRGRSG
jgi:glycosyltransferase involved in cell wall biosynthesis